jgi:general secretion pathway protein G
MSPGDNGTVDIFTLGADGQEGGEDINADIGNWNMQDFR